MQKLWNSTCKKEKLKNRLKLKLLLYIYNRNNYLYKLFLCRYKYHASYNRICFYSYTDNIKAKLEIYQFMGEAKWNSMRDKILYLCACGDTPVCSAAKAWWFLF